MNEPTSGQSRLLTREQLINQGKAARKHAPRELLADWSTSSRKTDPLTLLVGQEETRVPELVPIRHGRMAASAFAFYRGAALPMAADLSTSPNTGLSVQLCGDAHLANFGGFASPERDLVFDINDFDETAVGPFEWDVKRLAASLEIAGRELGYPNRRIRDIVLQSVRTYRQTIRAFARTTKLDTWYARLDVAAIMDRWGSEAGTHAIKNLQRAVVKAESKDRLRARDKLTTVVESRLRFLSDPPLLVPVEDVFSEPDEAVQVEQVIEGALRSYRATLSPDRRHLLNQYRYVALARKVVGVGSVGTRCWVALFVGEDSNDVLFLQVKEAEESVLERFTSKSTVRNHGQRVVEGQRLVQASSDIFLGWQRVELPDGNHRDFYVRQLWDWKASASFETMTVEILGIYASICAWTLARAHARSGSATAIGAYLGSSDVFDDALADFARLVCETERTRPPGPVGRNRVGHHHRSNEYLSGRPGTSDQGRTAETQLRRHVATAGSGLMEDHPSADASSPPPDPESLLRSKDYRLLLLFAAVIGVLVSLACWGYLELIHYLQQWLYKDLPSGLDLSPVPTWWPLPVLAVASVPIAFAIARLPGSGGHKPAEGLKAGPPTQPNELPGVLIASLASIGFGMVLGPEAPLIALAGGLAIVAVRATRKSAPDPVIALIAAAASFAAMSSLFGSPIVGAVIIIEAAGLGGATLPVILLPGLLAAGIGSLVFIGMGSLTGLSSSAYAIAPLALPKYHTPTLSAFGWTILLAALVAVAIFALARHWVSRQRGDVQSRFRRRSHCCAHCRSDGDHFWASHRQAGGLGPVLRPGHHGRGGQSGSQLFPISLCAVSRIQGPRLWRLTGKRPRGTHLSGHVPRHRCRAALRAPPGILREAGGGRAHGGGNGLHPPPPLGIDHHRLGRLAGRSLHHPPHHRGGCRRLFGRSYSVGLATFEATGVSRFRRTQC